MFTPDELMKIKTALESLPSYIMQSSRLQALTEISESPNPSTTRAKFDKVSEVLKAGELQAIKAEGDFISILEKINKALIR